MKAVQFKPEGWNNEITKVDKSNLEEYINEEKVLQGLVKSCDEKLNLHVAFEDDIQGIVPREEIEQINIEEDGLPKERICTGKVHKFIQFKIKDIDKDNNLTLSRKQVQKEALDWVLNDLKVGERVDGIVKNIKPYGAFVEIGGGVVGLVHIEDLSVARIKTPYERLKIGQKVEIVVKSIEREKKKVILSYKETLGTWEENANNFAKGMKTTGIIRETEKNKNGIFIELRPNLVGMAEYKDGFEYRTKSRCIDKKNR